ncbi:G-protein coupled receptor dmsr-1-like [Mercenaria mercenaria]|uniref:G-protein coupled receptor dmsr-1-like n=1 Tax=Mercenaria mercenaria TaxID=6596 RepID=UPI001E1E2064|nr:G-protein coupled receptor dmsr-1-like [Mercenaria mercenaria]
MNNSSSGSDGLRSTMYQNLEAYALAYWYMHPYISLIICTFGISTNIVNIAILCQKKMINSINCILTGIAISDILTMLDYVPYAMHFYLLTDLHDTLRRYTYTWSHYLAVHSCLSITTHTISLWLAVLMSAIRYFFIRSRGRWNISVSRTRAAIVAVYVASIIVCIPNYVVTDVLPVYLPTHNATVYRIKNLQIYLKNSTTMNAINVWLFILVGKAMPCVLICVFGCFLLKTLRQSQQLSESLKLTATSRRMRAHKRTTVMLLAIITMFIISELPSAILVLISVFQEGFFMDYYMLFADTLDMLSLTNNAINFIMYCIMSRQFRDCLCENLPLCHATYSQYKSARTSEGNTRAGNTAQICH